MSGHTTVRPVSARLRSHVCRIRMNQTLSLARRARPRDGHPNARERKWNTTGHPTQKSSLRTRLSAAPAGGTLGAIANSTSHNPTRPTAITGRPGCHLTALPPSCVPEGRRSNKDFAVEGVSAQEVPGRSGQTLAARPSVRSAGCRRLSGGSPQISPRISIERSFVRPPQRSCPRDSVLSRP